MKNIENFFYIKKIQIPSHVTIELIDNIIYLKGPLGVLQLNLKKIDSLGIGLFQINKKTNELNIYVKKISKNSKAFFGSLLSFFQNSFYGVCQGFLIYLELNGVGYRAILHEKIRTVKFIESPEFTVKESFQEIEFKIGQTHDIFYTIPKNIRVFSLKPTLFCLYGLEKTQITQIAAEIRNLKLPEPYKGKGIRYKDEFIQIKVGKKK
jgi:large subunit ribosomal protein L6